MKLKNLVAISIIFYVISFSTILVMGLWIVPNKETNGLKVTEVTASNTAEPAANATPSSAQPTSQQPTPTSSAAPQATTATPTPAATPAAQQPAKTTTTTTKTTTPTTPAPAPTTPTAPPPAAPACGSSGGTCTAAQVATHNSSGNCWVIYSNKYYIVTSYVSKHPGGSSVFNSASCGKDITGYMNGSQSTAGKQQRHSNSAYNILQSYYVGPVSG